MHYYDRLQDTNAQHTHAPALSAKRSDVKIGALVLLLTPVLARSIQGRGRPGAAPPPITADFSLRITDLRIYNTESCSLFSASSHY